MIALLLLLFIHLEVAVVLPFSINTDNTLLSVWRKKGSKNTVVKQQQHHQHYLPHFSKFDIDRKSTTLNAIKSKEGDQKKRNKKNNIEKDSDGNININDTNNSDAHKNVNELDWNVTATTNAIGTFIEENQKLLQDITSGNSNSNDDNKTIPDDNNDNDIKKLTKQEKIINENEIRELNASITFLSSKRIALQDIEIIASSSSSSSSTMTNINVSINDTIPSSTSSYATATTLEQADDDKDDEGTIKTKGRKRNILKNIFRRERRKPAQTPISTTKSSSSSSTQNNKYNTRLNQDILHLSSSIASTIDTIDQWILFVNDYGNSGFTPLFLCIHEAATLVRTAKEHKDGGGSSLDNKDEIFLAACRACRSLRNLSSLNPDLASVVTDSILHSNDVIRYNLDSDDEHEEELFSFLKDEKIDLVKDLIDLLQYFYENENLVSKALISNNNNGGRSGSNENDKKEKSIGNIWRRQARLLESRRRFQLYIVQLLLSMSVASDQAIWTFRSTPNFLDTIISCSSYAPLQRLKEKLLFSKIRSRSSKDNYYFSSIDSVRKNIQENNVANNNMVRPANQLLAALGYNVWLPKTKGQRGLRILCLDGGGTRGVTAITTLRHLVDAMDGKEVCDTFDMIVGTSTGAIIAFLVGLKRESSKMAKKRYDTLIRRIFVKSALSTPMLVFTTASYDEGPFMEIMTEILGSASMIESRCDPTVPYLFGVSSKMSSIPTGLCLFRNYNYNGGERPDKFVIEPMEARAKLGLQMDYDIATTSTNSSSHRVPPKQIIADNHHHHHLWNTKKKKKHSTSAVVEGSRHAGSFRVSQSIALRASTAAPTFFKPVLMRGELYCDGGIVTSNPAAVAIHEARILFPDIPIELLVSCGTGEFIEVQNEPKIGWDAIISQIVNSATDGEKTHHILEDILGQPDHESQKHQFSNTKYFRFNPVIGLPDSFPIDATDEEQLQELSDITSQYLREEEQVKKLNEISNIINGKRDSWWRNLQFWR